MIKVLIEGNGSEQQFWNRINEYMNNIFTIIPYNGVRNIYKIFRQEYNTTDIFIISIDKALDNTRIRNTVINFSAYAGQLENVYILDLICFEDTLLSFRYLINWIYSTHLRQTKKASNVKLYTEYKNNSQNWRSSTTLVNFLSRKYPLGINTKSIENLADALLGEITTRTGFHTDKGTFGHCFYTDCYKKNTCDYYKDPNIVKTPINLRCGLWVNKKNASYKLEKLYKYTKLYSTMQSCKRYFIKHGYNQARLIK